MQEPAVREVNGGAGCLLRVYWLFGGPAGLFFLLGSILQRRPDFPSLYDAGYVLGVLTILAARYIDIRHFKGQTGYGEPATLGHWRSYAGKAAAVGFALWLAVRLLVLH